MKNVFSKLATITAIILTIGMITSCQKNSNLKTGKSKSNLTDNTLKSLSVIPVKNGVLAFKNASQYRKTIEALGNYTKTELSSWTESEGFDSYNKRTDAILDSVGNVTSKSELYSLLKKYQDFIILKSQNGESDIDLTVGPNIFTDVANKDGLYIIDKKAYRLLGNYRLETNVNNIAELLTVHYPDIKNNNIPSYIKVKKYLNIIPLTGQNNEKNVEAGGGSGSGGGGSTPDYKYTLGNQHSTSTRRINLFAYGEALGSNDKTHVDYWCFIEAIAKKKILGLFWVKYSTNIYIEGTTGTTNDFSVETAWGVKSYSIPLLTYLNQSDAKTNSPYSLGVKTLWSYPGPEAHLIHVHVKAWTRGTSESTYASINYDLY